MTANDVMGQCKEDLNGTSYMQMQMDKYDELLTNVTTTMGKVYINFIATMDFSYIHYIQQTTEYCKTLHNILSEGGCIDKNNVTDAELQIMSHNILVFNEMLHNMAAKWHDKLQASGRKDVAVQMHDF